MGAMHIVGDEDDMCISDIASHIATEMAISQAALDTSAKKGCEQHQGHQLDVRRVLAIRANRPYFERFLEGFQHNQETKDRIRRIVELGMTHPMGADYPMSDSTRQQVWAEMDRLRIGEVGVDSPKGASFSRVQPVELGAAPRHIFALLDAREMEVIFRRRFPREEDVKASRCEKRTTDPSNDERISEGEIACHICMENRRAVANQPCGHFYACHACFAKCDKICNICRESIDDYLVINVA